MNTGRMLLAPQEPSQKIDLDRIVPLLTDLQLIAEPLNADKNSYLAGDRFMALISFAGCSPFLRFQPESEDDQDFCHIRLHANEQPKLWTGINSRAPKCSHCQTTIKDWREQIQQQQQELACQQCQQVSSTTAVNWGKHAGTGATAMEIFSVFPGEAVPSPTLLNSLKQLNGLEWRYFYVQL